MSLLALLRYALSDLRHRSVTTVFNVGAVALAAIYVLVLGFYGASIHRYQEELLRQSLPTRILASVTDVTDEGSRFTDERVEQLGELAGVARVFPQVEINVRTGLTPDRTVDVPAEGTIPEDPTFAPARMVWGGPVSDLRANEAILPRSLYEKVGGYFTDEPSDTTLMIEVGRTVDGREERQRLELTLVGLLDREEVEKVHVPLELLRELGEWCRGRLDELGGRGASRRARYPTAHAWVPGDQLERVEAEAQGLQARLTEVERIEVPAWRGPLWGRLAREDGTPPTEGDVELARGIASCAEVRQSVLTEWNGVRLVALEDDDPRLNERDVLPLATNEDGRTAHPDAPLHPEVDAPGDLVCDAGTWRRLHFEPRASVAAKPHALVEARDFEGAVLLASLSGSAPALDEGAGWAFFHVDFGDRSGSGQPAGEPDMGAAVEAGWSEAERRALTLAFESPRLSAEAWASGSIDVGLRGTARGSRATGPGRIRDGRIVPGAFLRSVLEADGVDGGPEGEPEVTPASGAGGPVVDGRDGGVRPPEVSCVLAGVRASSAPGRVELAAAGGAVDGLVLANAATPSLWTDGAAFDARVAGFVVWGDGRSLLQLVALAREAGWELDHSASRLPTSFSVLVEGEGDEVLTQLGLEAEQHLRISPFLGVAARYGAERVVVAAAEELGQRAEGRVCIRGGTVGAAAALEQGGWSSEPLTARPFRDLPPGLALVDEHTFADVAWAADPKDRPLEGEPLVELGVVDYLEYETTARALAEHGLGFEVSTPVEKRELVRFAVEDLSTAAESPDTEPTVGEDLIGVLRMSRPTFVGADGALALEAFLGERTDAVVLESSSANDPARYASAPTAGSWLAPGEANQVLLPRALTEDPSSFGEAAIGNVLSVRFERSVAARRGDRLVIPLKVTGVVDGDAAVVPLELLRDVELWQRGKVVFNETRGVFESPLSVSQRMGDVRCNVFADGQESVAPLVAALRDMGYDTRDSLAQQASLERLGRVLAAIVIVFVLGCLVNASITVFVATLMNVRSKIYEIGILRAHGLGRRKVVGIFAFQGLVVGVFAFLLASAVVFLLEGRLRAVVEQVFGLAEGGVLAGSPFDSNNQWLVALAFLVAVAFSLGGVILPAAYASSLSPVEALRRRE